MSKVHIGKEVAELLENVSRYIDASFIDNEIADTAFYAYKESSAILADKIDAYASDVRGFIWSLVGHAGLKPDVTAEEVVQMLHVVRPEVEM